MEGEGTILFKLEVAQLTCRELCCTCDSKTDLVLNWESYCAKCLYAEAVTRLRDGLDELGLYPWDDYLRPTVVSDMDKNIRDQYRGCLLGLACGDALGTTLEFRPPGTFEPITTMMGGGPFNLRPGEWTDDTSMALCLAESLVEQGRFDPLDQLRRYLRWLWEGYMSSRRSCFDVGNTVRKALLRFERTGEAFCGPTDPQSAGNGSIMRLAPVPMFFSQRPSEAIEKAAKSSMTTHGAATAVDCCRYMAGIIVGALNGVSKEELLSERYTPSPGSWATAPLEPVVDAIACGSFKYRDPPDIRGTGYVVQTLEAALWAFRHTNSFPDGCLKVVNLREDAEPTGVVYGQIAGAYYGEQAIPDGWKRAPAKRHLIAGLPDRLCAAALR